MVRQATLGAHESTVHVAAVLASPLRAAGDLLGKPRRSCKVHQVHHLVSLECVPGSG